MSEAPSQSRQLEALRGDVYGLKMKYAVEDFSLDNVRNSVLRKFPYMLLMQRHKKGKKNLFKLH